MSYKKPQIVAKSAAKKSYVAGCPAKDKGSVRVGGVYVKCAKCEISGH